MTKKIFVKTEDVATCGICEGRFVKKQYNSSLCPSCLFLGITKNEKEIPNKGQTSDNHGILKYSHSEIDQKEFDTASTLNDDENYFREIEGKNSEDLIEDFELSSQIDKLLSQLNEREQAVIRMRFGLLDDLSDRTLDEIANELSVTRERIRQIESSALKKLKHPKVGANLKTYINLSIEDIFAERVKIELLKQKVEKEEERREKLIKEKELYDSNLREKKLAISRKKYYEKKKQFDQLKKEIKEENSRKKLAQKIIFLLFNQELEMLNKNPFNICFNLQKDIHMDRHIRLGFLSDNSNKRFVDYGVVQSLIKLQENWYSDTNKISEISMVLNDMLDINELERKFSQNELNTFNKVIISVYGYAFILDDNFNTCPF